jgi:hypothetical protein
MITLIEVRDSIHWFLDRPIQWYMTSVSDHAKEGRGKFDIKIATAFVATIFITSRRKGGDAALF